MTVLTVSCFSWFLPAAEGLLQVNLVKKYCSRFCLVQKFCSFSSFVESLEETKGRKNILLFNVVVPKLVAIVERRINLIRKKIVLLKFFQESRMNKFYSRRKYSLYPVYQHFPLHRKVCQAHCFNNNRASHHALSWDLQTCT